MVLISLLSSPSRLSRPIDTTEYGVLVTTNENVFKFCGRGNHLEQLYNVSWTAKLSEFDISWTWVPALPCILSTETMTCHGS